MTTKITSKLESAPLTLTITATLPLWADLERIIEASCCSLAVDLREVIRASLKEAKYEYQIKTKQPQE